MSTSLEIFIWFLLFVIFGSMAFEGHLLENKKIGWYEECLEENKQYKCDYMWKEMNSFF